MAACSVLGLVIALGYYLWRGDGIAFTPGALLVVVSTALLLLASLLLATRVLTHGFAIAFFVLASCLDILGTALAAWLLEANWLLAVTVIAAIGWIVHIAFDAPARLQEHTL
jgi:hypothetical protein